MFAIDDTKDSDTEKPKDTDTKEKIVKVDTVEELHEAIKENVFPETITEAQQKRLFAIGKGKTDKIKEIILKHGYTTSKDILKADYNKICGEIEKI
jgi:hypothetical protein